MKGKKGIPEFCIHGHALVGDNLYVFTAATGARWHCKACQKIARHKLYEKNKTKEIGQVKSWQAQNRERMLATKAIRRKNHKESIAAYDKIYQKEHQEIRNAQRRERYAEDISYRQHISERNRAAYATDPTAWQNASKARRARLRSLPAISADMVQVIRRENVMWFGSLTCEYCRQPIQAGKRPWHMDHIVAVAANGNNDPVNLCVACSSCNTSKSDTPLIAWLGRLHIPLETVRLAIRVQAESPLGPFGGN